MICLKLEIIYANKNYLGTIPAGQFYPWGRRPLDGPDAPQRPPMAPRWPRRPLDGPRRPSTAP